MDNKVTHRRNTAQKQVILDTLKSLGSHKSATAVYSELQKTHPEIGRATVFRVLRAMAEDGVLLRIPVSDGEDRFDVTGFPHNHAVCRLCGAVDDVWLDEAMSIDEHITSASGFTIESERIEFIGLCKSCGEKIRNADRAERKAITK